MADHFFILLENYLLPLGTYLLVRFCQQVFFACLSLFIEISLTKQESQVWPLVTLLDK